MIFRRDISEHFAFIASSFEISIENSASNQFFRPTYWISYFFFGDVIYTYLPSLVYETDIWLFSSGIFEIVRVTTARLRPFYAFYALQIKRHAVLSVGNAKYQSPSRANDPS